jgi:hypothetical protein
VNAEEGSFDDGGEGEVVESVVEVGPYILVAVFFINLLVETVFVSYITRLVVSAKKD